MANRKITFFYALLIAIASLAVGMVVASRFGMSAPSAAQTAAPPMNSAPIGGPLTATTFRDIAKTVSPAVVNISTSITERVGPVFPFSRDDFFRDFFPDLFSREYTRTSLGSGVVIDGERGFIVTNHHVVSRASEIRVVRMS